MPQCCAKFIALMMPRDAYQRHFRRALGVVIAMMVFDLVAIEEANGAMTVGRWLPLLGFICLAIVVFTHVAEELHLFPGMG
jgi:hypothetical protein